MSNVPQFGRRHSDFGRSLPADTQRSGDSFPYIKIALGLAFVAVVVGAFTVGSLVLFNRTEVAVEPTGTEVATVASPDAALIAEGEEANLSTLHQLRGLGVRIALDDFGTGYSSLSYVQRFPFDKLKIDHSFVKDIIAKETALKIVRSIVTLARGLGMTTTAEGVETKEQLDAVRLEGCDEIQRYFISKPVHADEIERLYLPVLGSGLIQTQNAMIAVRTTAVKKLTARVAWPVLFRSIGV